MSGRHQVAIKVLFPVFSSFKNQFQILIFEKIETSSKNQNSREQGAPNGRTQPVVHANYV